MSLHLYIFIGSHCICSPFGWPRPMHNLWICFLLRLMLKDMEEFFPGTIVVNGISSIHADQTWCVAMTEKPLMLCLERPRYWVLKPSLVWDCVVIALFDPVASDVQGVLLPLGRAWTWHVASSHVCRCWGLCNPWVALLEGHRDVLLLWFLSFWCLSLLFKTSRISSVVPITAAITVMVIMTMLWWWTRVCWDVDDGDH